MSSLPQDSNERPASTSYSRSVKSKHSRDSQCTREETTPLLPQRTERGRFSDTGGTNDVASSAAASLRSIQDGIDGGSKSKTKWATIVSLVMLSLAVLAALGLGFAAPAVVEEYTKEALVFEPTNLSVDSVTPAGVRARIQGTFVLDGSRVQRKSVRNLGRVGTWIAREIECDESEVRVYLPEYGDILLGAAVVPPMKVNIQDGYHNSIDFLADLQPGDTDGIRQVTNDWLHGHLGSLNVTAIATLPLRSGFIKLGTRSVTRRLLFEGHSLSAA